MSPSPESTGSGLPLRGGPPEITLKAFVLSVVLSMVLAAANAYMGLFAGMTVSASIPAAVISMGVLRLFRRTHILENNIVQTAGSAGESLAAGVIFTLPALLLLGAWQDFDYFSTALIAGFGGLLGVLFTIPLRRALIVERPLQFPEGVATAEVLKVGDRGGAEHGVRAIFHAGVVGALFKFCQTGLKLWSGSFEIAHYVGGSVLYFGSNLSPALIAVGYIVGLHIAVLVFLGGALNWLLAIPLVALLHGLPPQAQSAADAANILWAEQTRYLGVGAMVVGGLWALIHLRDSLASGLRSSMAAYRVSRAGGRGAVPRTERDTPLPWVAFLLVVSLIPLFLLFEWFTGDAFVAAAMAGIMLVAGFLFSAVAGYMAGLVGSSNNPISGVTIATILSAALLLLLLLGSGNPKGPEAAILIGAVVCCAAAIAGDNMQDLKAGHLVGATPWKQQIMQCVGVLAAASILAPVLNLLLHAYGIGTVTPAHPDALAAPQAELMMSVAQGVFHGGLPWDMVGVGAALAVLIILLDLRLERVGSRFRTPVLAVAVGIYLPFELSVPILVGGLIARAVARRCARPPGAGGEGPGLLFSAGLITGEALVGIAMAVPIVLSGDKDVLALIRNPGSWIGVLFLALVGLLLYRTGLRGSNAAAEEDRAG